MCKQACESLTKREQRRASPSSLMMVPFLFLVENLEGGVFQARTLGNFLLILLGIYPYNAEPIQVRH